jgi:hypothetical protein
MTWRSIAMHFSYRFSSEIMNCLDRTSSSRKVIGFSTVELSEKHICFVFLCVLGAFRLCFVDWFSVHFRSYILLRRVTYLNSNVTFWPSFYQVRWQRQRERKHHISTMWCISKLDFMIISLRAKSKKNYFQNSSPAS